MCRYGVFLIWIAISVCVASRDGIVVVVVALKEETRSRPGSDLSSCKLIDSNCRNVHLKRPTHHRRPDQSRRPWWRSSRHPGSALWRGGLSQAAACATDLGSLSAPLRGASSSVWAQVSSGLTGEVATS